MPTFPVEEGFTSELGQKGARHKAKIIEDYLNNKYGNEWVVEKDMVYAMTSRGILERCGYVKYWRDNILGLLRDEPKPEKITKETEAPSSLRYKLLKLWVKALRTLLSMLRAKDTFNLEQYERITKILKEDAEKALKKAHEAQEHEQPGK